MHSSVPGPGSRFHHRDRIELDGTWFDPVERKEMSTKPVVMDLPDAGSVIPAPRQAPMRVRSRHPLVWMRRRPGSARFARTLVKLILTVQIEGRDGVVKTKFVLTFELRMRGDSGA